MNEEIETMVTFIIVLQLITIASIPTWLSSQTSEIEDRLKKQLLMRSLKND